MHCPCLDCYSSAWINNDEAQAEALDATEVEWGAPDGAVLRERQLPSVQL